MQNETDIVKTLIEDIKEKMKLSIDNLNNSLKGLKSGRISTALLEPIKVNAYGADFVPLSQVASISIQGSRSLLVQVWDDNITAKVEKAISDARLGLTPQTAGTSIKINVPELTGETRLNMEKKAKEYTENAKIAVRNIRRNANDIMKKYEKDIPISKDFAKKTVEKIQEMTDEYIKEIDNILEKKVVEINL